MTPPRPECPRHADPISFKLRFICQLFNVCTQSRAADGTNQSGAAAPRRFWEKWRSEISTRYGEPFGFRTIR